MDSVRMMGKAWIVALVGLSSSVAWAAGYELRPVADSSLFSSLAGDTSYDAISDGGPSLWVATTAGDVARRALLRFDVSAIPAGSRVVSVQLRLTQLRARDGHEVRVHRMTSGWQAASSSAGASGHGTAALPGDVTWSHRSYPTQLWTQRGGDFVSVPSTTTFVSVNSNQAYTWPSTPRLVADVQGWIDSPASNHGLILIGDEVTPQSAKRFAGQAFGDPSVVPVLVVEADLPTPAAASDGDVPLPLWALWGLAGSLFWLVRRRR